jgi:hypothetical protein
METAMVTAIIKTPTSTLTMAHQGQQKGQRASDVPRGGGGGGDVGGGAGERNGNGRGSDNGGSGRGGRWAGWAGAESVSYLFLPISIFLIRGAILQGLIFLVRQAFSKHLPH